jgi:general secretion pathway protein A
VYLDFYRLKRNPFHITPDPEFFFQSPSHREAWASIIYGIEERKGFVAITGEVGSGKTTVLRTYLEGKHKKNLNTVYIFNANLSFYELLKLLFRELTIPEMAGSIPEMVERLHFALIEEYKKNHTVVLVIDEAQNMPIDTLENLRMLSNLETSKDKLIQIVMVGQPEFDRLLDLNELRQLRQRIAIRSEIKPLSQKEGIAYIAHRLKKAGQDGAAIFSEAAAKRIISEAGGIPRLINIICDNALITGFGYQKKPITPRIVKEVVSDLKITKRRSLLSRLGFSSAPTIAIQPQSARGSNTANPGAPICAQPLVEVRGVPEMASRTITVSQGDYLTKLILDNYGYFSYELLDLVMKNNPGIRSLTKIRAGDRIVLPALKASRSSKLVH